ncbi:adhesion G protein-coupled receptor G3 isoform X3 [Eumetopias jubatus]|uniref:adhesion G protein-coupled receptor G3 isoform X3 n=1 Tax=Eumetopias jubatus TaxID=34886 RepID=UPI0010167739|nr:adhesion G protein-coupled receptor G3 isoform X3 [Eumetopias jubatus]
MVTPRVLGVLLLSRLLLWASGMEYSSNKQEQARRQPEQPRNVCLGLINKGQYESFHLASTASCFTKCTQSGNEGCNLENLQRYWLEFEHHLLESQSGIVNMSFLKAAVQNVSTNISEDLFFSLTPSQVPGQVTEDEREHPDRVRLPRSLFESLQSNRSEVLLAITVLDTSPGNLFKGPQLSLEDGSRVLNNRLVGLSLGGISVSRLAEPLEITFSHQHLPSNMSLSCVFWDVTKGSAGDWSSTGCSTELRAKRTVCRCDHLTFFALLLKPILDRATVQFLVRISQAGCGASMIFLAFTIVLYAVLSVGHGPEQSDATCWVRGAVFHYFLLCTFTWMGLEAFHLYLLVIKVFNTYFGHYFLKLSLVGWGLPALIVFGTGSADSYGLYAIRDKSNVTTLELCWFREKATASALYTTVHGYFLVTFLFGAVVLGLVAWKIFTLPSATAGKGQGPNWKGVFTVLGLSSLVGVTWWLAILTPLGRSTIYVFAVFNSLQGVFIFCWFTTLYFPSRSAGASSSGTGRADQVHTMSHE